MYIKRSFYNNSFLYKELKVNVILYRMNYYKRGEYL